MGLMIRPDLREALQQGIIIGDGAMGTYLYQLGFPIGVSYEEFNLLKPQIIMDVHRRYYEAGARLIETNTFSANRQKLARYGLEHEVTAINRQGVRLAREAVGNDAYVVGAVGPIQTAKQFNMLFQQVETDLQQQINILLEANVDGILLETFYDMKEMRIALQWIRKQGNVPVICQFAAEENGMTRDGISFIDAFQQLLADGADVVGFNCHSGPYGLLRTLEKVAPQLTATFSIFPNAGLPDYQDGKYSYQATPRYFAESALKFADLGARIIGGCCGTTPEHIAAMAAVLQNYKLELKLPTSGKVANPAKFDAVQLHQTDQLQNDVLSHDADRLTQSSISAAEPTLLELIPKRHVVIVEWDSPRDLSIAKFMQGSQALKAAGVDAITLADNSLAQTRISNVSMGHLIKDQLQARPLLHVACRDRNLIGTQSHLMGLHALGIHHILAITGDPAKVGDLPGSSSVYDLTSFELIRMTKQLNEGISFSGKLLKQKAHFQIGAAIDPNVKYLEKSIQRMEKKIALGADYFMTQPIFEPALIEQFYHMTKHLNVPIFMGVLPLISDRNAQFLHNEVPGIRISTEIRRRMENLEGAEGRRMGIEIAKQLIDVALPYFKGIYLMTPMSFYEMSVELTQYIWMKTNRSDFSLVPTLKMN